MQEAKIYSAENNQRGRQTEIYSLKMPEDTTKEEPREVQYVPPPRWGGRVVCVETGWIFKTISAAAKTMNGSQWALRKAVIRNTVYHGYHWRMFCDQEKKIEKFS